MPATATLSPWRSRARSRWSRWASHLAKSILSKLSRWLFGIVLPHVVSNDDDSVGGTPPTGSLDLPVPVIRNDFKNSDSDSDVGDGANNGIVLLRIVLCDKIRDDQWKFTHPGLGGCGTGAGLITILDVLASVPPLCQFTNPSGDAAFGMYNPCSGLTVLNIIVR